MSIHDDVFRKLLKQSVFMNMAMEIAKLGTCCRAKVGCILLRKDGSLAGAGYNGAPPGMDHCNEDNCNSNSRCIHTSHAEENALFFSEGEIHTAYVTHEPCLNCGRMLARRGVKIIYFNKPYTSMPTHEREYRDKIFEHYNINQIQL